MTRRTRSTPAQPRIEPKAVVAVARKPQVKAEVKAEMKAKAAAPSRTVPEPAPLPSPTTPKAPSGKLGTLLGQIGNPAGAGIDELADATGWQAHTIRAAFSRLRQRGFPIALVTGTDGRKAYRLEAKEG
ncbi:DUF3489 domain-containing protein [Xanthobacter autotrophicus]|uniref:DUF3489 domain-containing protein n=1 Tax=Xanthobacter autotrophicus TaxID=280 RepID=UPI003727D175